MASSHLCGGERNLAIRFGVLLFFPQGKWELLRPKRNSLASDSLRLVPVGNGSACSFRMSLSKFIFDLHLSSTEPEFEVSYWRFVW